MTARVAIATPRYGGAWDEVSVLAARLAGALACSADVDVLVPAPGIAVVESGWDGACRLLRFPAERRDERRRMAWRTAALGGAEDGPDPYPCACPPRNSGRLQALVEEQLVLAEGGDSPPLYDHLASTRYDAVVFVGFHSPVACFGVRYVPEPCPIVLVPGIWDGPAAGLAIHDLLFGRAHRILTVTEAERSWIAAAVRSEASHRVGSLGFLLGVNSVVAPDSPNGGEKPFIVVARDWRRPASRRRYARWAGTLARRLPSDVELRLVGPAAGNLAHGVSNTDARIEAWWWMSRAVALLDPAPHRVIGQEALEALLFGVPILVRADGGATREHAETGNAGLWYRVDEELLAAIPRLLDDDVRSSLGDQGGAYAAGRFADTDTYVKRVGDLVLN